MGKKIIKNQQGLVSIVVAVFLMLMMSMIVLAMAQNARREQRQSLDRQLSDQAFYNAESGINDAAYYLYNKTDAPLRKDNCLPLIGPMTTPGSTVPTSTIQDNYGNNKYTCLMYDKAPKNIFYDNITTSAPKVIPILTVDENGAEVDLSKLTLSWDDTSNRNGPIEGECSFSSGSVSLPEACAYGGLRVELVAPETNRDRLRQRSLIAFLLPNAGAGNDIDASTVNYPNNQGILQATKCTGGEGERRCSVSINNINRNNLYLSIRALYRPINITITGSDDAGTAVHFKDTQIMVDSTGKAEDVLRRVQVRIPAKSQYSYPGFGLQTKDSICKVLTVTEFDNGQGSVDTADPAICPRN